MTWRANIPESSTVSKLVGVIAAILLAWALYEAAVVIPAKKIDQLCFWSGEIDRTQYGLEALPLRADLAAMVDHMRHICERGPEPG